MLWVNGGGQAGSVCSQVLINLFPPQLLIAIGSLRSEVVWSQRVKELSMLKALSLSLCKRSFLSPFHSIFPFNFVLGPELPESESSKLADDQFWAAPMWAAIKISIKLYAGILITSDLHEPT